MENTSMRILRDKLFALSALGCLAIGTSAAQAVVVLSDNFSDNERATQSLPSSAAWPQMATNATTRAGFSAAAGNLDLLYVGSSSSHTTYAFFTTSGSPLSLANVGASISISAMVTMDDIKNSADGCAWDYLIRGELATRHSITI